MSRVLPTQEGQVENVGSSKQSSDLFVCSKKDASKDKHNKGNDLSSDKCLPNLDPWGEFDKEYVRVKSPKLNQMITHKPHKP